MTNKTNAPAGELSGLMWLADEYAGPEHDSLSNRRSALQSAIAAALAQRQPAPVQVAGDAGLAVASHGVFDHNGKMIACHDEPGHLKGVDSQPLVKLADAQAALAAQAATYEKQINAYKSLVQSLERQRTTLREGTTKWVEAVQSLTSEREANAILTDEIARLTAELEHQTLVNTLLSETNGQLRADRQEAWDAAAELVITKGATQ